MHAKTKIVFIIPTLARGGAENQLYELVRGLDRTRFSASVVLFENVHGYPVSDFVDQVLIC